MDRGIFELHWLRCLCFWTSISPMEHIALCKWFCDEGALDMDGLIHMEVGPSLVNRSGMNGKSCADISITSIPLCGWHGNGSLSFIELSFVSLFIRCA